MAGAAAGLRQSQQEAEAAVQALSTPAPACLPSPQTHHLLQVHEPAAALPGPPAHLLRRLPPAGGARGRAAAGPAGAAAADGAGSGAAGSSSGSSSERACSGRVPASCVLCASQRGRAGAGASRAGGRRRGGGGCGEPCTGDGCAGARRCRREQRCPPGRGVPVCCGAAGTGRVQAQPDVAPLSRRAGGGGGRAVTPAGGPLPWRLACPPPFALIAPVLTTLRERCRPRKAATGLAVQQPSRVDHFPPRGPRLLPASSPLPAPLLRLPCPPGSRRVRRPKGIDSHACARPFRSASQPVTQPTLPPPVFGAPDCAP